MRASRSSDAPPTVGNRRTLAGFRLLAALLLGTGLAGAAETCLDCHGLKGLAADGRPLWLDAGAHAGTPHGRLVCGDCHKGAESYPHVRGETRCDLPCHAAGATHEALAQAEARGVHARISTPPCLGCHPADKAPSDEEAAALCEGCHQDLAAPRRLYPDTPGAFGYWAHRRASGLARAPLCPDCHGVHGVGRGEKARAACSSKGCHPDAGRGSASSSTTRERSGASPGEEQGRGPPPRSAPWP